MRVHADGCGRSLDKGDREQMRCQTYAWGLTLIAPAESKVRRAVPLQQRLRYHVLVSCAHKLAVVQLPFTSVPSCRAGCCQRLLAALPAVRKSLAHPPPCHLVVTTKRSLAQLYRLRRRLAGVCPQFRLCLLHHPLCCRKGSSTRGYRCCCSVRAFRPCTEGHLITNKSQGKWVLQEILHRFIQRVEALVLGLGKFMYEGLDVLVIAKHANLSAVCNHVDDAVVSNLLACKSACKVLRVSSDEFRAKALSRLRVAKGITMAPTNWICERRRSTSRCSGVFAAACTASASS